MLMVHNHNADLMKKESPLSSFLFIYFLLLSDTKAHPVTHRISFILLCNSSVELGGVGVMRGNWVILKPQAASPPVRSTDPGVKQPHRSLFSSQMGNPVLASQGLHPRVHHWAGPSCQTEQWVQWTQRQVDRPVHRLRGGSPRLDQGVTADTTSGSNHYKNFTILAFYWTTFHLLNCSFQKLTGKNLDPEVTECKILQP